MWDRYNVDSDHKLSKDELLLMMEDLTEIKSGHRYVPSVCVLSVAKLSREFHYNIKLTLVSFDWNH